MLNKIKYHDTLFSLDFYQNYKVLKLEYSYKYECYIIYNKNRGKYIYTELKIVYKSVKKTKIEQILAKKR